MILQNLHKNEKNDILRISFTLSLLSQKEKAYFTDRENLSTLLLTKSSERILFYVLLDFAFIS